MIVGDVAQAEKDYRTALNTVRCYCNMHKYKFKLVEDSEYRQICGQRDFMFRRHCIVAELLKNTEWLMFLDADVAVVNPNVLLEEYIDPAFDITFYDRFVNWEVAAGSYIVRNTQWSQDFLRKFADFESQLPNSFHGTDNGALHVFLQRAFYPQLADESQVCLRIWERSTNWNDLFTFEACIRTVMGDAHEFGKARILKKGTAWLRDIWLTDSKWSPERDFMLHGLKDSNQISYAQGLFVNLIFTRFNWRSPFLSRLNLNDCTTREYAENWEYNEDLKVPRKEIEKALNRRFAEVERERWLSLVQVSEYV
uniref:Nucleotide-diphospho-sugar transferase domain-containing protein n=1 Tax=Caenorhabditis japonica TaxID=281687 RepID=A0A8R1DSW0_CAEJA